MVAPAQHREVRERGRPSLGPVPDVMALAEAPSAAREATPTAPMMERAAYSRRNRTRPRGGFDHSAVLRGLHHHAARAARHPTGRLRGNALATFPHRTRGRRAIG